MPNEKKAREIEDFAKITPLPEWCGTLSLAPTHWGGVHAYVGNIPLAMLQPNDGQIAGLPSNPREWGRDDLDRLKASIIETPELLLARGCVVTPHPEGDAFVILGGNMRFAVAAELGYDELPCIVIPDGDTAKLKQIVIKDNGSMGRNDWDKLANEWDDVPLTDWGINVWKNDDTADDDNDLTLSRAISEVSKTYDITFNFDKATEAEVRDYVDKNGKETLKQMILDLCRKQVAR